MLAIAHYQVINYIQHGMHLQPPKPLGHSICCPDMSDDHIPQGAARDLPCVRRAPELPIQHTDTEPGSLGDPLQIEGVTQ